MAEEAHSADEQTFAEWLQANMAKNGLSQAMVARALQVDPAAVSRWVSGRSYPISDFRRLLAIGFDVPVESVPGRYAGRKRKAEGDGQETED
jgi:transcriptional regulator with XRE-family HTH domain